MFNYEFLLVLMGNMKIALGRKVLIGLGFVNISPLIISVTINKFPDGLDELSGFMITIVVCGVIVTRIMRTVPDFQVFYYGFFSIFVLLNLYILCSNRIFE